MKRMSDSTGSPPCKWPLHWLGLGLVCLYLVLYLVPLNHRPLFIPDESRYAEISGEMLDTGNWAELRQVGLRYYEKPPLGYWLNTASIYLFGRNNFAVRLPSALSAGVTALAIFLFVRRVRRDASLALAAAAIYLSCVEVFYVGTFAVLDSMFAMFVGLFMTFFYMGREAVGRVRVSWFVLSGLSCAAAFLTKGFVALVVPALTVLAWFLWERRIRDLLTVWMIPILVAAFATLPFALIIHINNPGFWDYFIWVEHVQRFIEPGGGQHKQPFWFFLPVLAAGAMPWIFLFPAAIPEMRAKASGDSLTRYCLCWLGMPFLFFSACGGKLPTYILPVFVPLAILLAEALMKTGRQLLLRRGALAGAAINVIVIIVSLCWLFLADDRRLRNLLLNNPAETFVLGASILLAAAFLYVAARHFAIKGVRLHFVCWVALSLSGVFFSSSYFLPRSLEDSKSPSRLLAVMEPTLPENTVFLSDDVVLPLMCWLYSRNDIPFYGAMGELGYGLAFPEAQGRYMQTAEDAGNIVMAALLANRPVAVCMREQYFQILSDAIPDAQVSRFAKISPFIYAVYFPDEWQRFE